MKYTLKLEFEINTKDDAFANMLIDEKILKTYWSLDMLDKSVILKNQSLQDEKGVYLK